MDNVVQGLSKLSSGSLSGAYSGIIQASNGMKDAIGKTSENLREVPIIRWTAGCSVQCHFRYSR